MRRLPTIKQLEQKQQIHEFASRDITALQKYLNMSEEDKKEYLSSEYWYTWEYFPGNEIDVSQYEVNDYEDVENLPKDVIDEWNDWIYDKLEDGDYRDIGISDEDAPTWVHMNFYKILKNQWLVHLTNDADSVVKDGFIYGIDDISKLGLTTYMGDYDKSYGGYNFAYDIDDVDRFGKKGYGEYKYGDEAVFFRASGAKVNHYGDEEDQVIFYGNTATDRIPAYQADGGGWELRSSKNGEIIVTKNELGELGEWLKDNFAQYYKSLIS